MAGVDDPRRRVAAAPCFCGQGARRGRAPEHRLRRERRGFQRHESVVVPVSQALRAARQVPRLGFDAAVPVVVAAFPLPREFDHLESIPDQQIDVG